MLRYGFWLRSAIPGRGLWRVCVGLGISCTLLFLAGVLEREPYCARSFRFPPPPAAAGCAVGLCGGRRGRGFPPLSFFFGLPGCGGGSVGVVVRPVVLWLCGGRRRLSRSWASWSRPPPPPFVWVSSVLFFFSCPCGRSLATSPVGCVSACPSCPFLRPFGGCVVVLGRCFWLGVIGLGRVVRRCSLAGPLGVVFGVAWLGGLPASCGVGARLRGCVTASTLFLLSRWPAGARSWLGGGFPLSVFFFGRGFACSSLCLP